jgi:hypothetical protein
MGPTGLSRAVETILTAPAAETLRTHQAAVTSVASATESVVSEGTIRNLMLHGYL